MKALEGDRISLTLPAKWETRGGDDAGDDVASWLSANKGGGSLGSLGDAFSKLQF